jgi:hypothetical protein
VGRPGRRAFAHGDEPAPRADEDPSGGDGGGGVDEIADVVAGHLPEAGGAGLEDRRDATVVGRVEEALGED